jgi:glucose/arabinose dehydrogenase
VEPSASERLPGYLHPFVNGKPDGEPVDALTGFLNAEGQARGPPVGVALDTRGGLLVADDVGNTI